MTERGRADQRNTMTAGCLMAMGSALLTCLFLFVNGSLVMAVLDAMAQSGPAWIAKPQFMQFVLFSLPVLMCIVEWLMIDYVRIRLIRRKTVDRRG